MNYTEIKCKKLKKTFRIYKWENKKFKDFPMPKGFRWAKHSDFVYLYDNDIIELEIWPVHYYTQNFSKKSIKKGWELSGLYVYGDGDLFSRNVDLAYSCVDGRVVVEKRGLI